MDVTLECTVHVCNCISLAVILCSVRAFVVSTDGFVVQYELGVFEIALLSLIAPVNAYFLCVTTEDDAFSMKWGESSDGWNPTGFLDDACLRHRHTWVIS